eukprot:1140536-Pelagomonas_calceolata.AAC.7
MLPKAGCCKLTLCPKGGVDPKEGCAEAGCTKEGVLQWLGPWEGLIRRGVGSGVVGKEKEGAKGGDAVVGMVDVKHQTSVHPSLKGFWAAAQGPPRAPVAARVAGECGWVAACAAGWARTAATLCSNNAGVAAAVAAAAAAAAAAVIAMPGVYADVEPAAVGAAPEAPGPGNEAAAAVAVAATPGPRAAAVVGVSEAPGPNTAAAAAAVVVVFAESWMGPFAVACLCAAAAAAAAAAGGAGVLGSVVAKGLKLQDQVHEPRLH